MTVETAPQEAFTFTPLDRPVDGTVVIPGQQEHHQPGAADRGAGARHERAHRRALQRRHPLYGRSAQPARRSGGIGRNAATRSRCTGGDGTFPAASADLFIGNSGTSVRFLTAVLTLGHGNFRIDGIPRMRKRPIQPLITALNDLGSTRPQ